MNLVFVLKRLPWFLKFLSTAAKACAHVALLCVSLIIADVHKELIKAAGADHLLRQTGWLKLFRTEAGFVNQQGP